MAGVLDKTPLKIKLLVNFAPQNYNASSTMRPQDTVALVSILRQLDREPQFGRYSVVAFNIQEQRVIYRQDSEDSIDFPALGEALNTVKLGIVDAAKLQRKHGDTDFLTELIQDEMKDADRPDALVFAGPKVMLDASVPEDSLKPLTSIDYPVFYVNYALNPNAIPWRDSIGRAVRVFRGTEYTISKPRDLWFSMTELVSRIVRSKQGRGCRSERQNRLCAALAVRRRGRASRGSGGWAYERAKFAIRQQARALRHFSNRVVDRMLELAHLKPGETLYDLGCGDGRILIAAAEKYKVKAVGVEISPKLVAKATANIEKEGLADQASVIQGDVLTADLSDADVVTIYLATSLNERLRPRLERFLKAGARVISHDYPVPGWKAWHTEKTDSRHAHLIYVYEMPPLKN